MNNPYQLHSAEIVRRIQETDSIFSLHLRLVDQELHTRFQFQPGQFNMLYLFGAGEIPISIVSDPERDHLIHHTIRSVGRVSIALSKLEVGKQIGLRGPYGRGWPIDLCKGKNVLLITGGLGCAPSVSVIHYILNRRSDFGNLTVFQGVKKSCDMIWRQHYAAWSELPNTTVMLAADVIDSHWPGHIGPVTNLLDKTELEPDNTIAMLCGPERMMQVTCEALLERGFSASSIYLSMERNMQCAIGHCGHCQYGKHFVCKNGPVFSLAEIADVIKVSHY